MIKPLATRLLFYKIELTTCLKTKQDRTGSILLYVKSQKTNKHTKAHDSYFVQFLRLYISNSLRIN